MTIFVAVLMAAVAFAVIVFPYLKSQTGPREQENDDETTQKATDYAMLKELESDYQSGFITQDEFNKLGKDYRQTSGAVTEAADDDIEKRILETRKKRQATVPAQAKDEIEKRVQDLRQKKTPVCPKCGRAYRAGSRFCPNCGAPLTRGGKN